MKQTRALYIEPKDVFRNTLLQADIDEDKLIPFIVSAQEVKVQDFIGQNLYEHMDGLIFNQDATDNTSINHADNRNYRNLLIEHLHVLLSNGQHIII